MHCGSPAVSCVAARKVAPSPAKSQKQCAVAAPRWTRTGNTELPQRPSEEKSYTIERVVARIFREAGARVRFNALLQDMNVGGPQCRRATSRSWLKISLPLVELSLLWTSPFGPPCAAQDTPKRRRRQRGSAATSSEGQRDDPPRAGSFRKVSSGGPCNGDGRALE